MQFKEDSMWLIQDKHLESGMKAVCDSRNSLVLFPSNIYSSSFPSTQQQFSDAYMHEVKFSTALYSPFARKLINESRGIFVSSKKLPREHHDKWNQQILKISQRYRSVLLACIEELGITVADTLNEELISRHAADRNLFYSVELLWNLIEILWIDTQSYFGLLARLLEWIQRHFTEVDKKFQELSKSEEFYHHPSYWKAIFVYVLQGKITSARLAMKLHPDFLREDFLRIDELLRNMPVYQKNTDNSLAEFHFRWQLWKSECKQLYDTKICLEPNLNTICRILCGDNDVFIELSGLCKAWYHVLISKLLYTDPCISVHEIGTLAKVCYNAFRSKESQTETDTIIFAIFEMDILSTLRGISLIQDGWWFAAHLTDLLICSGHFNLDSLCKPDSLHESFLQNYASSLMCHSSLWQIGVDYLDYCKDQGRHILELHLEHIPLDSESKCKKIYSIANERNLKNLARSVCKVMAFRAVKNDMLGTALKWTIKSKDAKFASCLAAKLVDDYVRKGKLNCFEILSNLGFQMLVSSQLTFMSKYCEFHKLHCEKNFKVAAELLVSLLSSGLVPKQFHIIMLLDALPLLEVDVFTIQETYQLMSSLEGLNSNDVDEQVHVGISEKINLLRLALGRNLARAFIQEEKVS